MNNTAIVPGSFDPVTNGHMDIIERSHKLYNKVYVAVLYNINKKSKFSAGDRVKMLKLACAGLKNVEVVSSQKLLVDFMKDLNTNIIIRGIRTDADLVYEQQMASINSKLYPQSETVILLSKPETQNISSGAVRELLEYNQNVSYYVPKVILDVVYGSVSK